jgi:hypothetical protein
MFEFFVSINYFSIIISAIFYFILGAFWYCPIFGTLQLPFLVLPGAARQRELQRNHIVISKWQDKEAFFKIIVTFFATLLASFSMAYLVVMVNSATLLSGFLLGTVIAVGFSGVTLAVSYIWENRSLKLFIIDSLCPIIGIITSAIIISVFR